MKNQKLSKLAIAASGAMLLAGCSTTRDLTEYQKNAIQTKLEQMAPNESDTYIREQMDGVQKTRIVAVPVIIPDGKGGLISALHSQVIPDGLYLDDWVKHDTNDTLIDEYTDYAMSHSFVEKETKAKAAADFQAKKKQAKLQQKIDQTQNKIDGLGISTENNQLDELTK